MLKVDNPEEVAWYFKIVRSKGEIKEYYENIKGKKNNIIGDMANSLYGMSKGEFNEMYGYTVLDMEVVFPVRTRFENPVCPIDYGYVYTVAHLVDYIPKYRSDHDEESETILRFKNGDDNAIDHYYDKLVNLLKEKHLLKPNAVLCVVPSHNASAENINPMAYVARKIAKEYNMVDGTNFIIRVETINKKATASYLGEQRPTIETDICSMIINCEQADLFNKEVVLLDDVVTKGYSLQAVEYLLNKMMVSKVTPITIGRTVR